MGFPKAQLRTEEILFYRFLLPYQPHAEAYAGSLHAKENCSWQPPDMPAKRLIALGP
jgi:hypothetical protein